MQSLLSLSLAASRNPALLPELEAAFGAKDFDIMHYLEVGSKNMILLSIYQRFRESGLLYLFPEELQQHLAEMYRLNLERNQRILAQTERIHLLLAPHGIVPVYLKGTANLMDGLYPTPGERVIGDIDFMLPSHQVIEAAEILQAAGYKAYNTYYEFEYKQTPHQNHYPRLTHPTEEADVEIHFHPAHVRYSKEVNYDTISAGAVGSSSGYCLFPSDKDKLTLSFYHAHLKDHGKHTTCYLLRTLYDTLLLTERVDATAWASASPRRGDKQIYLSLVSTLFRRPFRCTSPYIAFRAHCFRRRYSFLQKHPQLLSLFNSSVLSVLHFKNSHIDLLIQAFSDKNLRRSMLFRLSNPRWYLHHIRWYARFWKR